MKKMKRNVLYGVVFLILCVIVVQTFNPLRKSEEKIREKLLELTPVGTDMDEVVKLIKQNEKWSLTRINNKHGDFQSVSPQMYDGAESMEIVLGKYFSILSMETWIGANYKFDKDSKVVDILVWKEGY